MESIPTVRIPSLSRSRKTCSLLKYLLSSTTLPVHRKPGSFLPEQLATILFLHKNSHLNDKVEKKGRKGVTLSYIASSAELKLKIAVCMKSASAVRKQRSHKWIEFVWQIFHLKIASQKCEVDLFEFHFQIKEDRDPESGKHAYVWWFATE